MKEGERASEKERKSERESERERKRERESGIICAAHAVEVNELKRGRDNIYRVLSRT